MTGATVHMHLSQKKQSRSDMSHYFGSIFFSALLFVFFFAIGYALYPPLASSLQTRFFPLSDGFLAALSLPQSEIAALFSCAIFMCKRELFLLGAVFLLTFSFFTRVLSFAALAFYSVSLGIAFSRLSLAAVSPNAFWAFLGAKAVFCALLLCFILRSLALSAAFRCVSRVSAGAVFKAVLRHACYGAFCAAAALTLALFLSFFIR